jgi:transcriptional regulator with XRE-family HTH domain
MKFRTILNNNIVKNVDLKENFDRLKKQKGTSATKVAIKMGVSLPAFYSYFNGQPLMGNLIKMADALGVDVGELTGNKMATNEVHEDRVYYQSSNQNQIDKMNELDFYRQQNETLKDNAALMKEKILRLERELKACQDGNRVGAH